MGAHFLAGEEANKLAKATDILTSLGYKDVSPVAGTFADMVSAGFCYKRGAGQAPFKIVPTL